jgi:hypothetical protein
MKTILCFILVLVSRFCPGQGPTPVTITSRATFNGDITSAWFIADVSSTQTRKVSGSTILQTAVKYVDTAGMLAPYARAFDYYRKGEADVRYLQSFTESDPIWAAASVNYFTKTQSDARYLQSFTETDPIWTAAASTVEIKANKATSLASADNIKYPTTLAVSNAIAGFISANQNISISNDASGSGATSISLTVNGLKGSALPALATGLLKYNGSAWVFDNTYPTTAVTSVGMSFSPTASAYFSVSGSPITTSGSFTVALQNQSANLVFAGPSSGVAQPPTFRSLVAADIPTVTNAMLSTMGAHTYKGNNTASTANPSDITSTQLTADLNLFTSALQGLVPASGGGTTNFLRADGTWAPASGGGMTNPMTAAGDMIIGGVSGAATRLAGNSTTAKQYLSSTGTGSAANAQAWATVATADLSTTINGIVKGNGSVLSLATAGSDYSAGTASLGTGILKSTTTTGALTIAVAADFPTLNQNTTGTAANITGVLNAASHPALTGDVTNTVRHSCHNNICRRSDTGQDGKPCCERNHWKQHRVRCNTDRTHCCAGENFTCS